MSTTFPVVMFNSTMFSSTSTSGHWLNITLTTYWRLESERKKERGLHLSSDTGLIQVLPGHPLAGSRRFSIAGMNTATETWTYTRALKPFLTLASN